MSSANVVVGVDYSMNGPGICVCRINDDGEFKFENCILSYASGSKNWKECTFNDEQIVGHPILDNTFTDLERQIYLSNIMMDAIGDMEMDGDVVSTSIEDYAFSRSGQLATLGENSGILQYRLFEDYGVQTKKYSPTTIKAFARKQLPKERQRPEKNLIVMTKEIMHEAFKSHTGVDLCEWFGVESVLTPGGSAVRDNPIGDIVDAYFIALYHHEQLKKGK